MASSLGRRLAADAGWLSAAALSVKKAINEYQKNLRIAGIIAISGH
jgi:hypothetical protein